MRSGTPSKSAEGNFFRGVIEKHVSEDDGMFTLRVEGFFRLRIYICIKHQGVKQFSRGAFDLSNKSFDNFLLCAKTFRKFLHLTL